MVVCALSAHDIWLWLRRLAAHMQFWQFAFTTWWVSRALFFFFVFGASMCGVDGASSNDELRRMCQTEIDDTPMVLRLAMCFIETARASEQNDTKKDRWRKSERTKRVRWRECMPVAKTLLLFWFYACWWFASRRSVTLSVKRLGRSTHIQNKQIFFFTTFHSLFISSNFIILIIQFFSSRNKYHNLSYISYSMPDTQVVQFSSDAKDLLICLCFTAITCFSYHNKFYNYIIVVIK